MPLNPQQLAAVRHVDGPLLILAGAGTGKTRVITERAANLVLNHDVALAELLCVTFTNKAAREMRERIDRRLENTPAAPRRSREGNGERGSGNVRGKGKSRDEMTISTFHSLGVRILRQYPDRAGLRKGFSIYTQSEQLALVRAAMRDLGVEGSKPERVHFRISRAKNDGTRPEAHDEEGEIASQIFDTYTRMLRQCNAVDFDDLQSLTLLLLDKFVDVREELQRRWRYIQVDEYQDTNAIQLRLLQQLVGGSRNIAVVGDDDQSIYAWRGAQVKNILDFEKTFGVGGHTVQVVRLEENYRSTGVILDAANAVIRHNPVRSDKTLRSIRGRGIPLKIVVAGDESAEVEAVINHIERYQSQGSRLNECAVLFRTAVQTRPFEEALRARQIPYTLIGGQKYFERKEVRDAVAYVALLVNDRDDAALMRAINYPSRGIGATTIEGLAAVAKERRCSMASAMRSATAQELREAGSPEAGAKSLVELADLMAAHRWRLEQGDSPPDVVRSLIDTVKLREAIDRDYAKDPMEARRRVQNVEQMIDSLAAFLTRDDVRRDGRMPTLVDWLERVALIDDQDDADRAARLGRDALVLITIHSCKGLEFKHVFVVGVEEGILPHKRSEADNSDTGLEEERRLAYVAMTRAKDTLFLSYCSTRKLYGRDTKPAPSRFLLEIPAECREGEATQAQQRSLMSDAVARIRDLVNQPKAAGSRPGDAGA
ncbi:MAG: ATP-dependent helicase [Planctomycetota bacterium]